MLEAEQEGKALTSHQARILNETWLLLGAGLVLCLTAQASRAMPILGG